MRRSMLFLPGNNPNMLINGNCLGSDAVIFDLEDAVSPAEKDAARILVRNTIRYMDFRGCELIVRINSIDTPYWQKDLDEILPCKPDLILLPKTGCAADALEVDAYISQVEEKLGMEKNTVGLMPLIETAMGVENAFAIASSTKRVQALFLGAEDLTADLQCKRTKESREIEYARTRLVVAARAAGVDVYDTPFVDVNDDEGIVQDAHVVGMHIHIGSQIRELHVFENMCNKVNVIVKNLTELGFELEFVDVGGGLGVNYDMPENEPIPNFASVFAIIKQHLQVGKREVHFEFGRSIVAECGELITKVLFNKTTATGRRLVIVDASMTELIRPALYGSYHNIENITSESEQRKKYTIVGTACESTDVFDENVSLPITKRGDLLTLKTAGAYGMSMASRYNQHDLPGAVYSDEL